VLSKSKELTLLIEIHGKDNYKAVLEILDSYNFKKYFEKSYEWGDKHVIARKID
jgi:hypothetical protein